MNKNPQGRFEHKYCISYLDAEILTKTLGFVAEKDSYVDTYGAYQIHSLYFDNFASRSFEEKMNGTDYRTKYRVRWYGTDRQHFFLEIKQKIGSQCFKEKIILFPEEIEKLLNGDYGFLNEKRSPVASEFYRALTERCYRPQTIVSYHRTPFIYPFGNVRITLDAEVKTSINKISPLQGDVGTYPVLESGTQILEVKYDEYLPSIIKEILQTQDRRQLSISKYTLCRLFG